MARKPIPQSAVTITSKDKVPISADIDYAGSHPCWRISNFDKDGPWGINSLIQFSFQYTEVILQIIADSNMDELSNAFDEIDGKGFSGRHDFWERLQNKCSKEIPISLIDKIEDVICRNIFFDKIYPKLKSFESNTWDEIRLQSHKSKGKMKSNNHPVQVGDLCEKARNRLVDLKLDDNDELYSLRLEGTIRIYGIRKENYLDIIWVDLNHEVYPVSQR